VASSGSAQAEYARSGEALQVQYQVDVYPTEEDAAAVMTMVESPAFGSCLGAALAAESSSTTTIGAVDASPLTIPSAADLGVDAAVGVGATIPISDSSAGGASATVSVQVVVLQHGAALGIFTVTRTAQGGGAPPIEVDTEVVQAAATKLAAIA
jgi:hypothetical protein